MSWHINIFELICCLIHYYFYGVRFDSDVVITQANYVDLICLADEIIIINLSYRNEVKEICLHGVNEIESGTQDRQSTPIVNLISVTVPLERIMLFVSLSCINAIKLILSRLQHQLIITRRYNIDLFRIVYLFVVEMIVVGLSGLIFIYVL